MVIKEIYDRFHAMRTWGKEPESLASLTTTMLRDLSPFPVDKILLAFSTHAQRSGEFPTAHDLISLIKRNGKPPIKESDVIAVRQKDASLRSYEDWRLLDEWAEQQNECWENEIVTDQEKIKITELQADNERLRKQVAEQEQKINDLTRKIREGISFPTTINKKTKAYATLKAMKDGGSSRAELEEAAASMNINFVEFETAGQCVQ